MTEQEALDHVADVDGDDLADAMEDTVAELETRLGREITGAEINKLVAHAQAAGDPDVLDYYQAVTGRSLDHQPDVDEDELMAEFVGSGSLTMDPQEADADPAEAPAGEDDE